MRITFILPSYPWRPSGGYRVVYEYANGLTRRGHQVTVVHTRRLTGGTAPVPVTDLARWLRRKAGWVRRHLFRPRLRWQPLDSGISLLYVPEPTPRYVPDGDAVFATVWETAEYVRELPPEKGQKFHLVMDFYPWMAPREELERTWRWPLKKVTISRWLYGMICQAGVSRDEVTNIPIAVDHQRFRMTNSIEARGKKIAMMYAFAKYKAAEDGIRVLEMARRQHPDLEAVVFGPEWRRPRGLPSWIAYRGHAPEIELVEIYNSSRLFVCSSAAEGFALPPAEAMACGCAVAATDCGGIREFAEHGVNALLSPPLNPEALAANVIRLLEEEDLRLEIARAGLRRIQEFTWERSSEMLDAFIRKNFHRGRSPSENAR
jgi:glycosyltransferase involved in cell wall biosynthesis